MKTRLRPLTMYPCLKVSLMAILAGCGGPSASPVYGSGIEFGSSTDEQNITLHGSTGDTNQPSVSPASGEPNQMAPGYTIAMCLADLTRDMKHAGDSRNMTDAQTQETAAAVISAATRFYPELDTQTVAQIMIANMRQESDFEPGNISGPRDGSGSAVGILQVSPYGNALELKFFINHFVVEDLTDWRTGKLLNLASLTPTDLKDTWINIHVATWTQSNLARSGSADPSTWGTSQGGRPTNYLTALGSWVAGPAASDKSGYGNSGDDASAGYFKGILKEFSYLQGTTMTTADLSALTVGKSLVYYRK